MTSGHPYDVLLEGTPFVDLTFSFATPRPVPALGEEIVADGFAMNPGSTFNAAYQLSGLGLKVGLLAVLGNDIFSTFVAQRMEAAGLSSEFIERRDEPLPLISAAMSTPQDRFFLSYEAPRLQEIEGPRITPHVLERYRPRAIVTWHRLHPDVYRCAQEMGISVVLDTFWDVSHLRSLQLRELAGLADIITPNLAEALEMTGTHRAEDALDVLSTWSPCVVITAGSDGCLAARGNERFRVPAIPVEARDTTGAGESFLAGLVYGLLQGYPFETCLRCANITGGLSTEALGGPGRRPSVTDIESWLAWYPNTAIH